MTKIFFKVPIGNGIWNIGYLQLVIYEGLKIPQLEFWLEKNLRGIGIMTKELPKYLVKCKDKGYCKLIANVEKDNEASIKLLDRNGFVRLKEFDEIYSYVIDLNLTLSELHAGLEKLKKTMEEK